MNISYFVMTDSLYKNVGWCFAACCVMPNNGTQNNMNGG